MEFWIGIEVSTKKEIYKLIYHFYNVNTYMWCYQYTGTKMIQNFGSFYKYFYISDMHTDHGTPSEHLTN